MDNIRAFVWVAFLGMLWLVYTAWTTDYAKPAEVAAQNAAPATPDDASSSVPRPDVPRPVAGTPSGSDTPAPRQPSELIRVRTDVLDVRIDLHGGDLVRADLPEYPVNKHQPDKPVRLLDDAPETLWVFQTGLASADGGAEPNHVATFRTASSDYVLADGEDALVVTLDWVGDGPVAAQKVYTFRRGEYAVELHLKATAPAGTSWHAAPYVQMTRLYHPVKRSYFSVDSYSVAGPTLYNDRGFQKLKFDDLVKAPVKQLATGGWFAAIQHHFVAAAVPPATEELNYEAKAVGQDFVLNAQGKVATVDASTSLDYPFTLFVGPKLQAQLKAVAPSLDRTVDYGRLYFLAQPLFMLLSWVERVVGNWGWAIVIVTFAIKLAFYKLTAMSARSMAKMRRVAPRMKALQERYKDDRQALNQAMLELYKKEGANPAVGCVPMLIQMPFFFAFYWVLVESVEMRQAPFMFWIDDLSSRDPFYVLPFLLGILMFLQSRMSPPPPDPVQARMMQIMPLVFAALFFVFPSGLVVYYLTNTGLSLLQQWRINKIVARESPA